MNFVEGLRVRADLHLHFWPHSKDSTSTPEKIVEKCFYKGIGLIAVTNHNTAEGVEEIKALVQRKGVELIAIQGQEVTTGDLNSKNKKIELLAYFVEKTIPQGLSMAETMQEITSQGAILGIPHPFEEWRHGVGDRIQEIINFAGEKETPVLWEIFNARALKANNIKSQNVYSKSDPRVNVLHIAGSDAHSPREIGRAITFITLETKTPTQEDFLKGLKNCGWTENDSLLSTAVSRGLIKMQHASRKLLKVF